MSKPSAPRPCSMTPMFSSSLKMESIFIGHVHGCSNTCSKSQDAYRPDVHPGNRSRCYWRRLGLRICSRGPHAQSTVSPISAASQDWHSAISIGNRSRCGRGRNHRRLCPAVSGQARSQQAPCLRHSPLSTVIDRVQNQHKRGWRARAGIERHTLHDSRSRISPLTLRSWKTCR